MMLLLAVWAIRAFYLLSSAAVVAVRLIPAFADRFLAYGARETVRSHGSDPRTDRRPLVTVSQVLDFMAAVKVPHSWFTHFYFLSVACSLACPFIFVGAVPRQFRTIPLVCSALMLVQGSRRLFECLVVARPSPSSRMWVGHYLIGIAFYMATNVSIWIEHLDISGTGTSTGHPAASVTTLKGITCSLLFLYASSKQHLYHRYLASLRKYTLPDQHAFRHIIAPHYTAECAIYLSLALLGAPATTNGRHYASLLPLMPNWTLLCALAFVAVNLGVTADGTKTWLTNKFPEKRGEIAQRWRMIPLLRWTGGLIF